MCPLKLASGIGCFRGFGLCVNWGTSPLQYLLLVLFFPLPSFFAALLLHMILLLLFLLPLLLRSLHAAGLVGL